MYEFSINYMYFGMRALKEGISMDISFEILKSSIIADE